jgi:hypothetical protein
VYVWLGAAGDELLKVIVMAEADVVDDVTEVMDGVPSCVVANAVPDETLETLDTNPGGGTAVIVT